MELDLLRGRISGELCQFFSRADADSLAAVRALPYRKRCAPVSVAGERPVLNILQPVAKASLAHGRRNPVDHLVVAHKIVSDCRHLDEPGLACVIDERRIASPAVRIIVLNLRGSKEQTSLSEVLQHLGIAADCALVDLVLCGLAAHARKLACLGLHAAVVIHHLYEGRIISAADPRIIFTEGRGNMYDARAVCHGDIVVGIDKESFLVLLRHRVCGTLIERLIFPVFEIFSFVALQDLVSGFALRILLLVFRQRPENGICKRRGNIIGIAVDALYLHILVVRVDAERDIGRKRPRRCGPCQEICILPLRLEADDGGAVLDLLVALCYLMGGEGRSAGRAVRNDLESLIKKPLLPDLLQCPPLGLNIVIIIGDIGVLHVGPEANLIGELLPHPLVFPHGLLALLDEGFDPVLLDLILSLDSDLLLDLELDRQTVGVPSGLSGHLLTLHGVVAGDHVLDDTCLDVADVGLAVGSRRSIIEHVNRMTFILLDTLLKDPVVVPELDGVLFPLNEIQVRVDFFIHLYLLHAPFSSARGKLVLPSDYTAAGKFTSRHALLSH